MPELPEVETICNNLRMGSQDTPSLLGMELSGGQVLWERSLATPTVEEFVRRLPGQVIEGIRRRGKFIIIDLSQDTLLVHLRMSGDLLVEKRVVPIAAHHRLLLDFNNGYRLAFNDARKFGRAWLVSDAQEVVGDLGPEPLDADFTAEDLYQRLHAVRRQLKPLLLDQRFLAGLGNIYTDEALHLAHLHPLQLSNQVSEAAAERLWQAIRQVLGESIRRNGASIDWVYRGGDFQNHFRVYKRDGLPCPTCGTPVVRIMVGQRGTHYCPVCQKNRNSR